MVRTKLRHAPVIAKGVIMQRLRRWFRKKTLTPDIAHLTVSDDGVIALNLDHPTTAKKFKAQLEKLRSHS